MKVTKQKIHSDQVPKIVSQDNSPSLEEESRKKAQEFLKNRKNWHHIFDNVAPEIQEYYKKNFQFDLHAPFSTSSSQRLFGKYQDIVYYLAEFPITESNDLWHGLTGSRICALVYFHKDIYFDVIKYSTQNRIVLINGNKVGIIECTHTIIYSGSLTELGEETSPLSLGVASLFPWEHFAALKSYIASIAEFGIFNLIKSPSSESGDDVPFGFNNQMQQQFVLALGKILPAQYADTFLTEYFSDILVEMQRFGYLRNMILHLPSRVLRWIASPKYPSLFSIFAKVGLEEDIPRLDKYLLRNPLARENGNLIQTLFTRRSLEFLVDRFLYYSRTCFGQLPFNSMKLLVDCIGEKAISFLSKFSIKDLISNHLEDIPSGVLRTLVKIVKISPLLYPHRKEIPLISILDIPQRNSKWINAFLNPLKLPNFGKMIIQDLWNSLNNGDLNNGDLIAVSLGETPVKILKKNFKTDEYGFHKVILPKQIDGKPVILIKGIEGGYCGAQRDPEVPHQAILCPFERIIAKKRIRSIAIDKEGFFYTGKIMEESNE